MTTKNPAPLVETAGDEHAFLPVLCTHATHYPRLEPADLAKLIFQSVKGPEHAVLDEGLASTRLEREWAALGDEPSLEPLLEPISPDGQLVRVHLRPFRQRGGRWPDLRDAFIASARRPQGTTTQIVRRAELCGSLADQGRLPFSGDAWMAFARAWSQDGYPAIHHSRAFRWAYRPAYRVLWLDTLLPGIPH